VLRYNDANELVQQVNGAGEIVNYEYDDIGRVTAIRTADGRAFVYHYDVGKDGTASGATLGRVAWVEEPTGGEEFAYDEEGRVVASRRVVKDRSLQEQRRYSPAGALLGVSYDDGFAYDVSYDDAGRPIKAGDYWSAVRLDARGAVVQGQFGNGVAETFERDALGQPTHLRIARSSGAALYDVTAARNAIGAITTMTDSDGVGLDHSATFGYDAAGRITQASIGGSARQYQFGYAWDGLQNLVSRAASGPKAIGTFPGTYVYGEGGASPRQLTRVKADGRDIVMAYDAAGRMTKQGDFTAAYNAFDELVQVLDAAGRPTATHDYGYDGLRTLTRNADGSEQIWLAADVTEKAGRREHSVEVAGRTVAKVSYQISALPSPATGPLVGGVMSGLGARIARIGGALRAAAAVAPELLVLCFAAAWVFASVRARARRRMPRPALAMVGLATTLMACGAHGPFDAKRSAEQSAPERIYFHQGFSAGPALFTRDDGSVEEERSYEPFGAPLDAYREIAGAGSVGDVDFAVESRNELNSETDPNTNWTYQGARWMLPQLARWASPDPPTKAPDPKFLFAPWDLNPYAYARANPVIFWDPDGQSWKSFAVGFVKGAVTAVATTVVFAAVAAVAPVAAAVVGGALLVKTGYDLYQSRHEIAAVGHRIASGTTTDADHELFGNVVGGLVGGKIGAKLSVKLLKPPPTGGGGCFVAGTPVTTARGRVPIETVAVGELVWSRNPETGEEGWKPVVRTVVHEDEPLVALTIRDDQERDETILATPDHPFWIEGRGWTPAAQLAPLDGVAQSEGHHGVVVAAVQRAATARVYNFEVEGWHTYFVGDDATLVHNNNCAGGGSAGGGGQKTPLGRGSTANGRDRWQPSNLREQLAVEEAMQNPGAGKIAAGPLKDGRWPAKDGWVKRQQTIHPGGQEGPISVHYNHNTITDQVDDFKIVLRNPPPAQIEPTVSPGDSPFR
jgi:RHS repeat-associated protein